MFSSQMTPVLATNATLHASVLHLLPLPRLVQRLGNALLLPIQKISSQDHLGTGPVTAHLKGWLAHGIGMRLI